MIGRREIAKRAGVSTTTVTRVLSNPQSVSAETAKKVYSIIQETGYSPNVLASNMSKSKLSNNIALLVPDMTNYYYMEMFQWMIREACKYGKLISIYSITAGNVNEVVDELIENRVCGIVNMGLTPVTHETMRKVNVAGIRFVHSGVRGERDCRFSIEYKEAIYEAVGRLVASGCRSFCFIFGMKQKLEHDGKIRAFKEAMQAYGVEKYDIIFGNYPAVPAVNFGYEVAEKMYRTQVPFDVLFCTNDLMAMGVIRALRDCGRRIPDEVSVIGFDNIQLGGFFSPSVATFGGSIEEEAKTYVRYCSGEDPGEVIVKGVFYPRESAR